MDYETNISFLLKMYWVSIEHLFNLDWFFKARFLTFQYPTRTNGLYIRYKFNSKEWLGASMDALHAK